MSGHDKSQCYILLTDVRQYGDDCPKLSEILVDSGYMVDLDCWTKRNPHSRSNHNDGPRASIKRARTKRRLGGVPILVILPRGCFRVWFVSSRLFEVRVSACPTTSTAFVSKLALVTGWRPGI